MKTPTAIRLLLGALLAGGMVLLSMQTVERGKVCAAAARPPARQNLNIGLWTLWHDREVSVTPGEAGAAIRLCSTCVERRLKDSEMVRANGDLLSLSGGAMPADANAVWLRGSFTLAAHGERIAFTHPVSIRARSGVLVLTVVLPTEDYVARVVASESGPGDSMESLKALAIVVRSFALHVPHAHADYDLCDSTHCQLLHWAGNPARAAAARAATLATAGETLWYRGRPAVAYFNKDCGGRTASPAEIWPHATTAPYLPSRPDSYCTAEGNRQWSSAISRADLAAALAVHGIVRAGWQNLRVARRGESGRAVTVRIDSAEIPAEDFRLAIGESLGWNRIPSTWFEVSRQGDSFQFNGRGWGHGVGLCQKGGAAMAAQGHSMQKILGRYFPGAVRADESTGVSWQSFARNGFVFETLDAADAAYLPDLARARAEAAQRSGLNASDAFTVRAFPSVPAFRAATEAPGWVAAFTQGNWIGMQPLRTLAARHLLDATMRHEFLHALVEREAGSAAPLWLREGLVELWAGDAQPPSPQPRRSPAMIDVALARAASEADGASAHRDAVWYAAQLLARYGRAQVLEWLRSGVPASALAGIGQR